MEPKEALEEVDIDELASQSIPGKSNIEFIESGLKLPKVIQEFQDELLNWFNINEITIYRNKKIGINCTYRWTIKRWGYMDMDGWLEARGWRDNPHRKADQVDRDGSMLEARYSKTIEGYKIYATFLVEMTQDIFDKYGWE